MFKGKHIIEGHSVLQKHFLVYVIYVNGIPLLCWPR